LVTYGDPAAVILAHGGSADNCNGTPEVCELLSGTAREPPECGGLAAHLFDGKELCYVASEARFEEEASN
jgi:hypothetical protein